MPGYLGGGSSGGSGGEISFPKELIDPVTKIRVSQPETLIDTDFEYGLQPTKWETLELINNTPSFFSKSGDTTIDGIESITTNANTREITVKTKLDHALAAGIPINVTGTKSITADGAYIINSIPDTKTFTYLCKDIQDDTLSIEDLYSSIVTGEFFQGSQIRISDNQGIVTDAASPNSILTVTTDSTHGFGVNTPFYFLNINSTISQAFDASNTTAKSFDASNSATAQTFDGSNSLSQLNIDFTNSANSGGAVSNITTPTGADGNNITVSHGTENFANQPLGTPLYYNITAASGYFNTAPRGVVFLKTVTTLGTTSSKFEVSEIPDGDAIVVNASLTGTIQLANQARTFAGNNVNPLTEQEVVVVNNTPVAFDASNTAGKVGTKSAYSGSLVTVTSPDTLEWYFGAMVFYSTNGVAASGLTNNTTYFIDTFFPGAPGTYYFTLKPLPTSAAITSISGGTGTETFKQIGLSLDRNIVHLKDNGYVEGDMVNYTYPVGTAQRFGVATVDEEKNFYFIQTRYDQHNFSLIQTVGEVLPTTQTRVGADWGTAITPTTVTIIGMAAPVVFSITSGVLPAGLTLNTSTGVVSGTPTETIAAPGRVVVITAKDAVGNTAFQTHTYQFNQPPFLYAFSSVTFGTGGASSTSGPNISQARSAAGNPSWANTYLNMSVNGVQLWTVPQSATYRINTYGARGGYSYGWRAGGNGARMQGDFTLTQGEVLKIVVGQQGYDDYYDGGGGGGTYVATSSNTPLVIAGGGGGGGPSNNTGQPMDANTGTNGYTQIYGGGTNGNGGGGSTAGGGGGFYSNGSGSWYGGGFTSANSQGGSRSAFGGGGGGGGTNGAGGGGGYSGGGGTYWSYWAGGGGSYNSGTNQVNSSGANFGMGYVTITKL